MTQFILFEALVVYQTNLGHYFLLGVHVDEVPSLVFCLSNYLRTLVVF
jgi:hypothetical protein